MRRCKDDWVNATQILKCCNFPKAKRTKILEKGVQQGLHEKIQGGYGRFQGTWIPLEDAQRLAASYGVTPDLAPVLYLDASDPNMVIPKKVKQVNKDGTPVKRKYTKKAKKPEDTPSKKVKTDGHQGPPQEFNPHSSFESLSRTQAHLSQNSQLGASSQQQLQYQMPQGGQQMPPTFTQADFMNMGNGMPTFTAHNQAIQNEFQNYQMQFQRFQHQQQQPQTQAQQKFYRGNVPFAQAPGMPPQAQIVGGFHHTKLPLSQSTNETNLSQDEHQKDSDTSLSSTEEQFNGDVKSNMYMMKQGNHLTGEIDSPKDHEEYNSYSAQLLKFFSEDNSNIPYFLHNPPYDFNINEAIDDEGHTPLHWAASIGNYVLIHLLISKGANPLVVNSFGLNPLSKLISFNNCYELKNFPKVLDDLELCLINTDINGRTPLHYLCQFSKVKTKYESLRYYLGIILAKLTSLSKSANNKSVNLLKNVVDHQDVNGDTCLHLAAKFGSNKIFKFLVGYGARDDLVNVNNETPRYLNMQYNLLSNGNDFDQQQYQQLSGQQRVSQEIQTEDQQPTLHPVQNQILATPIQSNYRNNAIETPDTQRTTVQDDDIDDDEDSINARVNKEQLDQLMKQSQTNNVEDDKENIFIDDSLKAYNPMSTPVRNPKTTSNLSTSSSHQPLAVISERTVENTPIKNEDKKFVLGPSITQTHKPNPPKLDDEGRIIEPSKAVKEEGDIDLTTLLMTDLSSMITGMINSLSDSYGQELTQLRTTYNKLQSDLTEKERSNGKSLHKFEALLKKGGIENFESIEQGKSILQDEIKLQEHELNGKEIALLQALEKTQAYQLANLVEKYELNLENDNDNDSGDEFKDEERLSFAIELTHLQLQRNKIINEVTNRIKNYGIDSKMYKYRKLISLSCGLKVEDIDGLIDGIEESLMETSMT